MDFPFGEMNPDLGAVSASMVEVMNALPTLSGYAPYPSLYTPSTATALPSSPRGIYSLVLNSGAWVAYGFTASAFYMLGSNYTWGTAVASGYACPTGYDWSALHFGTKLLFTNAVDGLRAYDVEAGGAVSYISAAGDPAAIFSCANFLVAVNCKDTLGNRDIRLIKTSGFNDHTNWTTDGADYQELSDGEQIYCGFDLKNNQALIVQARALVLMSFGDASGGAQFSLRKISDGKGAISAKACASFDGTVFMLQTDDFYRFDLSNGPVPIGADKIARDFIARLNANNYAGVQCAVDPLRKVVMWRFPTSGDPSTTVTNYAIGYEWHIGRWFYVNEQTAYLTRLATVATTYDAATGTYDAQTLTYDDLFWQGSAPLFGALNSSLLFSLRTGTSLQAKFTTRIGNARNSSKIIWATLIGDAVGATIELGTSQGLNAPIVYQSPISINDDGRYPVEAQGLNMQWRVTIPAGDLGATGGGWQYCQGLDYLQTSSRGPK